MSVCVFNVTLFGQESKSVILKGVFSGVCDFNELQRYTLKSSGKKLSEPLRLINQALLLSDKQNYDSALSVLIGMTPLLEKIKNPIDKNSLLCAQEVLSGGCLFMRGEQLKAQERFNNALSIMMEQVKVSSDCAVLLARCEAYIARKEILMNNFPLADRLCKEALEVYSDSKFSSLNFALEGKASVLNSFGIVCAGIPHYSNAKKKYEEALEIYALLSKQNKKSYEFEKAVIFSNLGSLYDNVGSFDEALLNYNKAEIVFKNLSKFSNSVESSYAKLLTDKGNLFRKISLEDSAFACLNTALDIFVKKTSLSVADSIRLSILYDNLASLYIAQKNFRDADECYNCSYKIKKIFSQKSDTYLDIWADVLGNYGMFCVLTQDYDLAIYYLQEAVLARQKLEEKFNNSESKNDLAVSFDNLAYAYILNNDYSSAEINYEKSSALRLDILPFDTGVYLDSYYNTQCSLSGLYQTQNNYDKALDILDGLLETLKRFSDTLKVDYFYKTAVTYYNTALIYSLSGNIGTAVSVMEHSWQNMQKAIKSDSSGYFVEAGNILLKLGNLYADISDFDRSEEYYKKCIDIRQMLSQKGVIPYYETSAAYNNLALLYCKTLRKEKAKECFFKAQKLFELVLKDDYDITGAIALAQTLINEYECSGLDKVDGQRLVENALEILKPFLEFSQAEYFYNCLQKISSTLKK